MKRYFPLIVAATFLTVLSISPSYSQTARSAKIDANHGTLSDSDFKFACAAATGGKTEVELGQLAARKSTQPAIKSFGEMMVADHSKAGEKLAQVATAKGAVLPTAPNAKEQKEIARLEGLSGTEFDKEYVKLMLSDHKKDVKEFQSAAKKSDAPEIRSFASETLPVLERHLAAVRALSADLKLE